MAGGTIEFLVPAVSSLLLILVFVGQISLGLWLVAILALLRPPQQPAGVHVCFLVLGLVPLGALIPELGPAPWADWLPPTHTTPQPLLLLDQWPAYIALLGGVWWLAGQSPGPRAPMIWPLLGVALAGVAICGLTEWHSGRWFGPLATQTAALFPTRNQAATFCMLTALAGFWLALVGNPASRVLAAFVSIVAAIVVVRLGSRAGILRHPEVPGIELISAGDISGAGLCLDIWFLWS